MLSFILFLICLICLTIYPKSDLQCRRVLINLLFIKFLWLLRSLKCTSWIAPLHIHNTALHHNSLTVLQLLWSFSCFLLATTPLLPLCFCSWYSHLVDWFFPSLPLLLQKVLNGKHSLCHQLRFFHYILALILHSMKHSL